MRLEAKTLGILLATHILMSGTAAADFVGINATANVLVPLGDPVVTAPLSNSDSVSVPISMLFTSTHSNWAGVGFSVIYDPGEVSFLGLAPRPAYFKTNTPSVVPVSLPTLWHTAAQGSGIMVINGGNPQIADLTIHATGTSTINNGDTDVRITLNSFVFNIYHVTDTGPLTVAAGSYVYVTPAKPVSGIQRGVGAVVGPPVGTLVPVAPGAGKWIKLANTEVMAALPSAFWGSPETEVGTIEVEHAGGAGVPALTGWGVTALLAGLLLTSVYMQRRVAHR